MTLSPRNPTASQRCPGRVSAVVRRLGVPVRRVSRHSGACRRGTSLIEMGAALALLGTVLALLVPVLTRTTGLREQVDRREVALSTVANLLERATLVPQPTPETLQPIADQLAAETRLTAPLWKIVVTPEQAPAMNRVEVSLSWQGSHQVRSSVSLVRWYRGGTP